MDIAKVPNAVRLVTASPARLGVNQPDGKAQNGNGRSLTNGTDRVAPLRPALSLPFPRPGPGHPAHAESLRTDDAHAAPCGAALTAVKCAAAGSGQSQGIMLSRIRRGRRAILGESS
jgi:hypothetical protein